MQRSWGRSMLKEQRRDQGREEVVGDKVGLHGRVLAEEWWERTPLAVGGGRWAGSDKGGARPATLLPGSPVNTFLLLREQRMQVAQKGRASRFELGSGKK